MSSTYSVLCLSHDPAIYATTVDSPELAEQAIRDGVDGHDGCDLMIGRYSYPLVELGCPGRMPGVPRPAHACPAHRDTTWVDADWIRLLALAQQQPDGSPIRTAADATTLRCFTPERLHRLRDQLGTNPTTTKET